MAYTTTDFSKFWSAQTFREVRRSSIMYSLTSREWTQPWVAGQVQVTIPVPDWEVSGSEGVGTVTRNRAGNWATANKGDQDTIVFERSGGLSISNTIDWEDVIELPWPVVEQTRSRQAYEMSKSLDDAIYTYIDGQIAGETSTPNFEALGSNTNNIDRVTGRAATSAASELVYDAISDYNLKLAVADIDPGAGDAVGSKWLIMRPEIFVVLREFMLDKKYSWDPLTEDLLRNNSVLAGRGYQGRLLGVDIFVTNTVPKPSGKKSNTAANRAANWRMLAGLNIGCLANTRPPLSQFFTPSENQISANPAYLFRQVMDYGHKTTNLDYYTLYAIDGGADS